MVSSVTLNNQYLVQVNILKKKRLQLRKPQSKANSLKFLSRKMFLIMHTIFRQALIMDLTNLILMFLNQVIRKQAVFQHHNPKMIKILLAEKRKINNPKNSFLRNLINKKTIIIMNLILEAVMILEQVFKSLKSKCQFKIKVAQLLQLYKKRFKSKIMS